MVQRLAVRIVLDLKQIGEDPLRFGLASVVTVDTAIADGFVLANTVRKTPAFESNVLTLNLDPVNQVIAESIQANAS